MKKRIIILALSTACACLGEAQENNIENRTVDLGTQTTTEFRKLKLYLLSTPMNWKRMLHLILTMPYMVCCQDLLPYKTQVGSRKKLA